jgi:predicted nucleic acid-binding protein
MMLVLDTDHVTEYQKGTSSAAQRLKQRLESATEPYATTIITVEENMRGWMAAIRRTTIHDAKSLDTPGFSASSISSSHGTSSNGMLPPLMSSSP